MIENEFREIGYAGGKIIFSISTNNEGHVSYQISFRFQREGPCTLIALYSLPQGIPVKKIIIGGIGSKWDPPPYPDCYPVFIASDSQGSFGHKCPSCNGYWRSGPYPNVCPYCAIIATEIHYLSEAQLTYIRHYCEVLENSLQRIENGDVEINMDEVADAVNNESEKPEFYISEQSQQCKFICKDCGEFNDILGRFGFCSMCGTRNDLLDFKENSIEPIRERLNLGHKPEDCLRDIVSSFDSYVSQIANMLVLLIPMTYKRKERLTNKRFHNFREVYKTLKDWFDIDATKGLKEVEIRLIELMFHRRQVYEHKAGEVDEKYIRDSDDESVLLKQHIHESKEDIHKLFAKSCYKYT